MPARSAVSIFALLLLCGWSANAQTWTQVAHGSRTVTIGESDIEATLVVAPGKYLAATAEGIFRSTDGGSTWSWIDMGLSDRSSWALYMHPDGRTFAGTSSGLFVSSDSGATWNRVMSHPAVTVHRITRDSQVRLFTAVDGDSGAVCRSTDNGTTWKTLLDSCIAEAIVVGPGDVLFAACMGYDQWGGLRKSTDAGDTWQVINPNIGVRSVIVAADGSILMGGYVGAQLHTYRSSEGGATWGQCAEFYAEYFAVDANNIIYAASNLGMQKSTDNGASWQSINTGLFNQNGSVPWLRCLTKVGTSELLAAEYNTGELFRSTDLGSHWSTFSTVGNVSQHVAGNFTTIVEKDPGQMFIGSSTFGMSRWTAAGGLVSINNGLANRQVQALCAAPNGYVFAGTTSGIFRSTDNGDTWTKFSASTLSFKALANLPNGQLLGGVSAGMLKFAADGSSFTVMNTGLVSRSVNTFWVGTDGRTFAGTESDLYQLDSVTWIPKGVSSGTSKVTDIDILGQTIAVATRDSGTYVSTDNGQHWQQKRTGIEGYAVRAISLVAPDRLYACTEQNGAFMATTTATPWTAMNQGISDLNMRGLLLGTDGCLYAITDSGAVLKTSNPVTGVEKSVSVLPTVCGLDQNYPNPFNPSTKIGFGVLGLGSSWVTLAVYDLLGREVAVLVNEKKEPGSYEVQFDGRGLSSGVYFYRMQVRPLDSAVGRDTRSGAGDPSLRSGQSFMQTRKLLLVR